MAYIDNAQIKARPLYRGLMRCSAAAGLFAAVAGALLLISAFHGDRIEAQNVKQLRKIQRQYDALPHSDAAAGKIRALDVVIRREALRRQGFSRLMAIYCIVALVTSVGCLLIAKMMMLPEPAIPKQPICAGEFIQWAKLTRMAITVAAVVLAALGLFFAFHTS